MGDFIMSGRGTDLLPPADVAEAERACTRLVLAFAYHVDHREFEQAAALFTEDGSFERPGAAVKGREALLALWAGRPETVVTRHVCGTPLFISMEAAEARAVTYFTMYQANHNGPGIPDSSRPFAVAEYHDQFRREGGVWKIAARRVVVAFMAAS
jgi:hypothetical protein